MTRDAPPEYDAFISYRRKDGTVVARRLRQRLISYRLPKSFGKREKLEVYLDEIYEQATEDFFKSTIKPALKASRNLIVVQSPGAATARDDGSENWVSREVRYFRTLPQKKKTWVALGVGDYGDPLPGALHEHLPNVERVDVAN